MSRLATVVNPIFQNFLPIADQKRIRLDLDLPEPFLAVKNSDRLRQDLHAILVLLIARLEKSEICVSAADGCLVIKAPNLLLTKPDRELIAGKEVIVKSRLGFGTTILVEF